MRIRTIKPEFFQHEELADLEHETGLPLRVAFAGLWCAADREGRFRWKPRRLKNAILPYDNVKMDDVLDVLARARFVVHYSDNNEELGVIPAFLKHQRPRKDEAASRLSPPRDCVDADPSLCSDESAGQQCIGNREYGIGNRNPPTPHKWGARDAAKPARRRTADTILKLYGEVVKPPSLDHSRHRARQHIQRLLGSYAAQVLKDAVGNYADACKLRDEGPSYRKNAGNFFGREAVYMSYLPGVYESPPRKETKREEGVRKSLEACEAFAKGTAPDPTPFDDIERVRKEAERKRLGLPAPGVPP